MTILDAPADTLNYMVLGFTVILGTMAIFIVSLAVRFRKLRRDLAMYDDFKTDE